MIKYRVIWLSIIILFILNGCISAPHSKEEQKVINRFFKAVRKGDVGELASVMEKDRIILKRDMTKGETDWLMIIPGSSFEGIYDRKEGIPISCFSTKKMGAVDRWSKTRICDTPTESKGIIKAKIHMGYTFYLKRKDGKLLIYDIGPVH